MTKPQKIRAHLGKFALILAVGAVAGCDQGNFLTGPNLQTATTDTLCVAYEGGKGGAKLADELLRRNATTPAELAAVRDGHVRTGMGRCAVLALLGTPVEVHQAGADETLGFADRFVTLENGRVVEISK